MGAQAGWYPDPAGSGRQRYFDGSSWTEHFAPAPGGWQPPAGSPQSGSGFSPHGPPGYGNPWQVAPPWKGAEFGRPAFGPGSLANQGRRLGARLIDGLVLLPAYVLLVVVAIVLVAPHVGPIFPKVNPNANPDTPQPFPTGILWIYLAIFASAILANLVQVLYESVATARYGRTIGKACLHIRPIRTDGSTLGWGRSFGRAGIYWAMGLVSILGLLNDLWCLWDVNQQCLHDKVIDTLVVNDPS